MTHSRKHRGEINLFLGVLTALPIILLFQLALSAVMGVRGVNKMAREQLLNHIITAGQQATSILFFRRYEPMEKLCQAGIMEDSKAIVEILKQYPEVTGLYKFSGGRRYVVYSGVAVSELFDSISQIASEIHDTLKVSYREAFWNSSLLHADLSVNIEGLDFIYSFCNKEDQSLLMVTDPRSLIPVLDQVFDQGVEKRPYSRNYFSGEGDFSAEVKFQIQSGEEIFSYGNGSGTGWKDKWETDLTILPWRMSVQIFSQDEYLVFAAEQAGKRPWLPFAEAGLGAVLVLVLVFYVSRVPKPQR